MRASAWRQRIVPLALGLAMFIVVLLSALPPGLGVGQSPGGYGTPAAIFSSVPWWIVYEVVVVVVTLIMAYVLVPHRDLPPEGPGADPPRSNEG